MPEIVSACARNRERFFIILKNFKKCGIETNWSIVITVTVIFDLTTIKSIKKLLKLGQLILLKNNKVGFAHYVAVR